MSQTGYNPSIVTGAIMKINSAYSLILTDLVSVNHSSFVAPMAYKWGSPQAVDFFSKYKTTIEGLKNEIVKVFTSVVESMNSAATSLATIAGAEWGVIEPSGSNFELDVSCIKDKLPDGTIGIDQEAALGLLSQLDNISSKITGELSNAVSAVGNSGFIGGGMQESLCSSLNKIKGSVETAFSQMKSQVVTAINDTASTYTSTSTNISGAFGGGQG